MERSIIPSVEKKDIIRKLKWEVNNRLIVPCYEDQETISMGERLVPHEQFSMRFPFDTSLRGALSPFAILYRNFGYYGLDQEGYDILGEYLKESSKKDYEHTGEYIWVGTTPLNILSKPDKGLPPYLFAQKVEGQDVYFPTRYYIIGNK